MELFRTYSEGQLSGMNAVSAVGRYGGVHVTDEEWEDELHVKRQTCSNAGGTAG